MTIIGLLCLLSEINYLLRPAGKAGPQGSATEGIIYGYPDGGESEAPA